MKLFSRFPVFRIVLPFSAGIIYGITSSCEYFNSYLLSAVCIIISFLFTRWRLATGKYANRWLAGIPFYLSFYFLGICITALHHPDAVSGHFPLVKGDCKFLVTISKSPVTTKKGVRFIAEVKSYNGSGSWIASRGNLLIYVSGHSKLLHADIGDYYLVSGIVSEISNPGNPSAFDYSSYMLSQGVRYRCFVKSNHLQFVESGEKMNPFRMAAQLRNQLLVKLKKCFTENERIGVAGALLLGYDEWLDPELERDYAAAGVLHILCVSGMHVGLMYVIMSWLLSLFEKSQVTRPFKYIILISFIWFYAMVTGFAPSVVRAASMLSFVIGGKWFNHQSTIQNILCASCMVLFVFDPFMIASAGFQLSFLAVCGIVFVNPLLNRLWYPENQFIQKCKELVSISIAAQLATFPVSIFLFHQFPNYFLVANLVIVPLSTLVMYSGLILMATSDIPWIGTVVQQMTGYFIDLLNYLVKLVSNLPGSTSSGIYITLPETIILYLTIILLIVWLVYKYIRLFFILLCSIMVLLTLRIHTLYRADDISQFTVYNSKYAIYSVLHDRQATLIYDKEAAVDINYVMGEHLVSAMVARNSVLHLPPDGILKINGGTIVMIRNLPRHKTIPSTGDLPKVKVLVFSGKSNMPVEKITDMIQPEVVVFDPTCSRYFINKFKRHDGHAGVKIHDVKYMGAYVLDF